MDDLSTIKLIERFSQIEDPRDHRAKRHSLRDIIVIAICAVISGAESWVGVEEYGKAKLDFFERLLDLPNGIPSHDTFGRVFARLDPERFQRLFSEWAAETAELIEGEAVAIDGKTLRRSRDKANGNNAIHMVSARAGRNHLILGQRKVDGRSNEITAIPELLDDLDVSGCVVTIDAMGCQKEVAAKIVEKGADYALALKRNQPQLRADVGAMFSEIGDGDSSNLPFDYCETVNKDHGRIETRRCWSVADPEHIEYFNDLGEWTNLRSVAMVESERLIAGERTKGVRYYISSLPEDAARTLSAVRAHWGIENSAHWVLDVAFREDDCRVRCGNAAENFSTLRRMALNMLKRETAAKGGVAVRRQRAGWDNDYLLTVLKS